MVLDMESEFYKLAKNITGNPKNLHKLLAISPGSGRMSLMGADGGVIVSAGMLKALVKARPEKAYTYGKRASGDLFGALIKEFDQEVENLDPAKKMELAVGLARSTGWGNMRIKAINSRKRTATIEVADPLESRMKDDKGFPMTAGYIAGLSSVSFGADMICECGPSTSGGPTFTVKEISE
ncbi:MAG: hypothetical protein QCI82_06955 [Candidatus Thermoplasmatota archaeon]|nr:hypothetical protein [Candidatus Thermoplasmatota archaeon]